MYILEMLQRAKENGGATVRCLDVDNYKFVTYKTGYQVALAGGEVVIDIKYEFDRLINLFKYEIKEGDVIGLWFDKDLLYIDSKSRHFENLAVALLVAEENKQISIYDWFNDDCIYL
jgi:hypothetical protein